MVLFLFLAGCAVTEESRPVLSPVPNSASNELQKKAMSGQVTFEGLSRAELANVRVIPESGTRTFEPQNRSYSQVDGFWWRGDRERWFKIPDHGEAWVGRERGRFDGQTTLGSQPIYFRSNPLMGWANSMRGGVKQPGWVGNEGSTKCHVPFPWIDR
ncbi:MAG: hypothetical protein ACON38_04055 [Akkermansiaceae bacterium]